MAEVDTPAAGGSFAGSTTDRGRTPGGRFSGDGVSSFTTAGLSDSILWIGINPPTGDQYVLWINTVDARWYGKWNDGDSTQWVDLSLPFGEGLPGPQGPTGERGLQGLVGEGIPVAGVAEQILVKVDGTDYNTYWGDRPLDGLNVLNGTSDPNDVSDGVDGEFFINTTNWQIFGPKDTGAWPAGVDLIGADSTVAGPAGTDGTNGTNGTDGTDGVDGVDGAITVDAPSDGEQYARKDAGWEIVAGGSGDVEEAPSDGTQYARKDAGWEAVPDAGISDAPSDGEQYARKDAGWEIVDVETPITTSYKTDATSNYDCIAADFLGGVVLSMTSASACTVTVPSGLTGTEPLVVIQEGAGAITFTEDSTTLNSADSYLDTRVQYSSVSIIPKGSDVYIIVGDLE